jgi:hypothetical protein
MKHLLLTTIAAVVLVGCGESQQSVPTTETKPVGVAVQPSPTSFEAKIGEPVVGSAKPETRMQAQQITIHNAVESGNLEKVKEHLNDGLSVNGEYENGFIHLHFAGTKEMATLLIEKGADVNAKSEDGITPLHGASSKGLTTVVELLISKGADVNARRSGRVTALDFAISREETETAALLRKHGGKTRKELKAEGK